MKIDMSDECGQKDWMKNLDERCELAESCPSNREGPDKWCNKCFCVACTHSGCDAGKL